MRLDAMWVVFRKELVDVLRDRRTLIFMVVVPTVVIPLLMWVSTELVTHFREKLAREQVEILVLNARAAPALVEGVSRRARVANGDPEYDDELDAAAGLQRAFRPNFRLITDPLPGLAGLKDPALREQALLEAVRTERIAAAVEFADDAADKLGSDDSTEIRIYYLDASDRSSAALDGMRRIFRSLEQQIVEHRLQEQELPSGFASPLKLRARRLPGPGLLVKILSQILPYMILIFAFLGAMYPAIDLGAGEKERGTLETLLVAPVSRLSIVLGKFGVILVAALTSAVLATISLSLSLQLGIFSTLSAVSGASFSFSLTEALAALLLIVPISCIFAALLLALSIFAKSFKEGQSYASPLQLLVIMPAIISFVPGVKLDWLMASIPVVNVSLALKEIFTGNLDQHWAHVGVIFISTSIFTGLLLWFATWWFQREQVLFRS